MKSEQVRSGTAEILHGIEHVVRVATAIVRC